MHTDFNYNQDASSLPFPKQSGVFTRLYKEIVVGQHIAATIFWFKIRCGLRHSQSARIRALTGTQSRNYAVRFIRLLWGSSLSGLPDLIQNRARSASDALAQALTSNQAEKMSVSRTKVLPAKSENSREPHLRVFSPAAKAVWAVIVSITIITEIMPIPLMPPIPFYSYKAAKVICFLALGYLAPLAFWKFNALNRGILLAAISAACVESLQGLLRRGHSFHWYELLVKLGLILLGFALALDARYERAITVGPIRIRLVGEHLER